MKTRIAKFFTSLFFFLPALTYPVIYDPGDFINAAKRSYSVVDDFLARWDKISGSHIVSQMMFHTQEEDSYEKFFKDGLSREDSHANKLFYADIFYEMNRGRFVQYFDFSFSQETITDFNLKTQFGLINMDYKRRAVGFTLKYEEVYPSGMNPGVAISSNGAWQGFLKQDIQLIGNNQVSQGNPEENSFTDFYYNQVFDDIYVLSLFFKPFVTLHAGILVNNEIDLVDGILGNGNDVLKKKSNRYFFNSNLFGFFSQSLQFNKDSDKAEKVISKISLSDLIALFAKNTRRSQMPDLNIGYQSIDSKTKELPESHFISYSKLHTLFIDWDFYYYKLFYLKGKMEAFLNHPVKGDSGYLFKQSYLEAGLGLSFFDYLANNHQPGSMEQFYNEDSKFLYSYLFFGFSYLTDSRAKDFGHSSEKIYGYTFGLSATIFWYLGGLNLELRYANNYSPKIENLIEAVDHNYYSISLSISF